MKYSEASDLIGRCKYTKAQHVTVLLSIVGRYHPSVQFTLYFGKIAFAIKSPVDTEYAIGFTRWLFFNRLMYKQLSMHQGHAVEECDEDPMLLSMCLAKKQIDRTCF